MVVVVVVVAVVIVVVVVVAVMVVVVDDEKTREMCRPRILIESAWFPPFGFDIQEMNCNSR